LIREAPQPRLSKEIIVGLFRVWRWKNFGDDDHWYVMASQAEYIYFSFRSPA